MKALIEKMEITMGGDIGGENKIGEAFGKGGVEDMALVLATVGLAASICKKKSGSSWKRIGSSLSDIYNQVDDAAENEMTVNRMDHDSFFKNVVIYSRKIKAIK